MHISEGILNAPVLITATGVAVVGIAIGLRRLRPENLSESALLASAFFVASLIHAPILGTSAHLILNGLMGIILGWIAFPVIFVALAMQALLFQYGGITTLGVNTLIMALPAVAVSLVLGRFARSARKSLCLSASTATGFLSVLISGLLGAGILYMGGNEGAFFWVAGLIAAAHLPIAIVEGVITGFAVLFLRQVYPELLHRSTAHQIACSPVVEHPSSTEPFGQGSAA